MGCGIGARAQETLDGCSWSWSQMLLHGEAWNLGSGYITLSLEGKQVNSLRDERGLSYVYIISSFSWLFEWGAWGPWTGPPNFEIWKSFFLNFGFLIEKFNRCLIPWKMLLPPPVKINYCPPWNKSFLRPSSFVCRTGDLKFFAHVPLSIKYIILRHLLSMLV